MEGNQFLKGIKEKLHSFFPWSNSKMTQSDNMIYEVLSKDAAERNVFGDLRDAAVAALELNAQGALDLSRTNSEVVNLIWNEPLQIEVNTVAKVASSTFLHSLRHKHRVHHGHSLKVLRETIDNKENNIIVSGIRNPLHRNLSYFFQTYADNKFNNVRCRANNYEGEYCYLMEKDDILSKSPEEIIDLFFAQKWHYTFNDWFDEFFEITGIDSEPFDQDAGYKIYQLKNGHRLLFYVFEKFSQNTDFFSKIFGVDSLAHTNNPEERVYKQKYRETRNCIQFPEEYKKELLDTRVMNYFYLAEDIARFHAGG